MAPFAERRPAPVRAPFEADGARPRPPTASRAPESREPAAHRHRRSAERRRRERHLRLLRRDLLVDVLLGLVVMIVMLIVTAGLGVIALIALPAGVAVIASFLAERRWRRDPSG